MSLTLPALQAMFAHQTDEVMVVCLKIDSPEMAEPIYFVDDNVDLVRDGNTYLAFPFRVPPPDDADEMPRVTLQIDNVSREIVQIIRSVTEPPSATVDAVLRSDPNTIQVGPWAFEVKKADYNVLVVSAELSYEAFFNIPSNRFFVTPGTVPGAF